MQSSSSCLHLSLSKNNPCYYFQLFTKALEGFEAASIEQEKKTKKVTTYVWTLISTKLHQGAHQSSMVKMKQVG